MCHTFLSLLRAPWRSGCITRLQLCSFIESLRRNDRTFLAPCSFFWPSLRMIKMQRRTGADRTRLPSSWSEFLRKETLHLFLSINIKAVFLKYAYIYMPIYIYIYIFLPWGGSPIHSIHLLLIRPLSPVLEHIVKEKNVHSVLDSKYVSDTVWRHLHNST